MEVYLEDITDEVAAADGGPPPRPVVVTKALISGDSPSARGGHTATRIKGSIYVYGGANREQKYFEDVYRLRIASMTWEKVQLEGTGPVQRSGHSAVAWTDRAILIYGGLNMALETFFDDAWLLTVPEGDEGGSSCSCVWSQPAVEGARPVARNSHSACVIQAGPLAGSMLVVGGGGEEGPLLRIQRAELRQLPGVIRWSDCWHTSHAQIAPREMHAAVSLGCYMLVFGGRLSNGVSDEVIALSAKNEELKVISIDRTLAPRCGHALTALTALTPLTASSALTRCGHGMTALNASCLLVTAGIDLASQRGPEVCCEHLLIKWTSESISESHLPPHPQNAAAQREAVVQELEGKGVKELREMCKSKRLDASTCTEKRDLIDLIASKKEEEGGGGEGGAGHAGSDNQACAVEMSWQLVGVEEGGEALARFAHSAEMLDPLRLLVFGGIDLEHDYCQPLILHTLPLCVEDEGEEEGN